MDAHEKRFRQMVRKRVRDYVRRERQAPPLLAWFSEGGNPRKVAEARVGQAAGAHEVRENIVAGVREHGSAYVAIGKLLVMEDEGLIVGTSVYGVVFVSEHEVATVEVPVTAGKVGAWREAPIVDRPGESPVDAWLFVQQAVRSVGRERRGAEERAARARAREAGLDA